MGEALARRGEYERAHEYLCRALATLGRPFPVTPGAARRALVAQMVRQLGHVLFSWRPRRSPRPEVIRVAEERCWTYYSLALMDAGGIDADAPRTALRAELR